MTAPKRPLSRGRTARNRARVGHRRSWAGGCRRSLTLATCIVALFAFSAPARAAMFDDDPGGTGSDPIRCDEPLINIDGLPYVNGLTLVGEQLEIVGDRVKVVVAVGVNCSPVSPAGLPFEWTLTGPSGAVALDEGDPLRPSFRAADPGTYVARLTYCPASCSDVPIGSETVDIPALSRSQQFKVVGEIPLPPATTPVLPSRALEETFPAPELDDKGVRDKRCGLQDVTQVFSAQLVTFDHWDGAGDYQLVEGTVPGASVASSDSELNHHSHDTITHVVPDPAFQRRKLSTKDDMEIEWETDTYPGPMRALPGDRISARGFWVLDCHHDPFPTEIHPAVMTAVHRPRPIRIADDWIPKGATEPLGTGLYVPGIVTDIWANMLGGEMTECGEVEGTGLPEVTGLHQPATVFPNAGQFTGPCIPHPNPFGVFTFNIYLPENPQQRAMRAGLGGVPPVPLYVAVEAHPILGAIGAPDPTVTPHVDDMGTPDPSDDVTSLKVSLDLSGYGGLTYARRIVAGWATPDPGNWGLGQWRIGIPSLDVYIDHDPLPFDVGDWDLWAAINDPDKHWTQLLADANVAEGHYDFGGRPWETGPDAPPDRSLGSDVLLFSPDFGGYFIGPAQGDLTRSSFIHMSGFDNELWEDGLGHINHLQHLIPPETSPGPVVLHHINSSQGDYTLNYRLQYLGPVGGATLRGTGQSLHDAYLVRPPDPDGGGARCTPIGADLCVVLPVGDLGKAWHPLDEIVGSADLDWYAHDIFKPQPIEEWGFTGMTLDRMHDMIEATRAAAPEILEAYLGDLRAELDLQLALPDAQDYRKALAPLELHIAPDLWQFHFGKIDPTPVDLAPRRLIMSPPGAAAGQPVVFSGEVVNDGTGASAPFSVALEIDGGAVGTTQVANLAPGAIASVDFPAWTAVPGTHAVRLAVDSSSLIEEPSETDNTMVRTIDIAISDRGLPDLQSLGTHLDPAEPVAGQPVRFIARMSNPGGNALDAFTVRFIVDGAVIGDVIVEGLAAGAEAAVPLAAWTATTGKHSLNVILDHANTVAESKEKNNVQTRSFEIA